VRAVLILGGTTEAAVIARRLVGANDLRVISSLAGRTREPVALPGEVRIGGFGGAAGLAEYLRTERIDIVVVATHPFADRIARNAALACAEVGVRRLSVIRPAWERREGESWIEVENTAGAVAAIPRNARIFLTVGRQEAGSFAARPDAWFLIRVVDPPDPPFSARHALITARGPFSVEDERTLMVEHRIDILATKNAGGNRAKLDAARELAIPVVMIRRPPLPTGETVTDAESALVRLNECLNGPGSPLSRG